MSSVQPCRASGRSHDCGLATLSWLLITAAVAGLAALAVVLVTAQVEDTAERISNSEARVTAAIHTAFTVEADAMAAAAGDFEMWDDWERHFRRECSLIAVLYADAEVGVVHNNFDRATGGGTAFDTAAAGHAAAADDQPASATKARVQCQVR